MSLFYKIFGRYFRKPKNWHKVLHERLETMPEEYVPTGNPGPYGLDVWLNLDKEE